MSPEQKLKHERIAVLSCIHGNMEALDAVLDDVKKQKPNRIVCLGDLAGYGPYPNEVIKRIEAENIDVIMGCWDEGLAQDRDDCGCKFVSEEEALYGELAFHWTKSRLSKKNLDFLKGLDFAMALNHFQLGYLLFVHGSPRTTSEYLMDSTHDLILFERAAGGSADVLICGHTHVPFSKRIEGVLTVRAKFGIKDQIQRNLSLRKEAAPQEIRMKPKWIINAGSVGEPRDGRPESSYVLLDTRTESLEIRRVAYDVQKTVNALKRFGLPDVFSERLIGGAELAEKKKDVVCSC